MKVQTLHISSEILAECCHEASSHYPLESGGTFMGYVHNGVVVVDGHVGAGPIARRQRFSFTPDQEWQLEQIALHYEQSGRRSTYVGDWHSHPGASSGHLSAKDCGVLKRIMSTPAARCAQPIMAILWGGPRDWELAPWSATLCRRRFGLGSFAEPFALEQRLV